MCSKYAVSLRPKIISEHVINTILCVISCLHLPSPSPQNLYPPMGKRRMANPQPTAQAGMTRQLQDQGRKERRGLPISALTTQKQVNTSTLLSSALANQIAAPPSSRKTGERMKSGAKFPYAPSLSLSRGQEEQSAPWQRKACSKWQKCLYFLNPIQHANGAHCDPFNNFQEMLVELTEEN